MSDYKEFRVVEKDAGPLRFELVSPQGVVVATFKTREQAEASVRVCNRFDFSK